MISCNTYIHNPTTGECDHCAKPESHHPHKNSVGDYSVTIYNRENKKQNEVCFHTLTEAMELAKEAHDPPHTTATVHLCMFNSLEPRKQKWEKP